MKKIYLLAVAALALTACDNDNITDPHEKATTSKLQISASINEEACLSRAGGGSWQKGDRIGVIATVGEVVPESFHPYVNLGFIAENDGAYTTLTGPEMLFYNHLTISGYHPYQGSEGTVPGGLTDGFLIKTDTRIDKQADDSKAIDFLHATKDGIRLADANTVELAFSHMMTKLTFTFESNTTDNNKVDVARLVSYQIEGLVMDGSFNTLTGECVADSDEDAENLEITGLYIPQENRDESHAIRTMKSLIVFPQTPKGDVTLRMYLDEAQLGIKDDYQVYFCTIRFGENRLKPGYHYNFKVNITKAGLQLGAMTIADWGPGVNSTIIATIDGEDVFFEPEEEN